MRAWIFVAPLFVVMGGCNYGGTSQEQQAPQEKQIAPAPPLATAAAPDPLAAHDPAMGEQASADMPDAEERPVMQAQVVLDRLGFTPGVVDGKEGMSTRNAVSGFQEANGLSVTGNLDEPTSQALSRWNNIPATRVVTIPADFAAGPFYRVPARPADQAKMSALGYESLDEKLAERFHTTIETLKLLNPGGVDSPPAPPRSTASPSPMPDVASSEVPPRGSLTFFRSGQKVRVPNVGGDAIDTASMADASWAQTLAMLGVGSQQPKAATVIVSKAKGTVKAYDEAGKLIAVYTATMGSRHDPLPLGNWKIVGVDKNPKFHYNPDLFWDAKAGDRKATLPAGPNGPVGVVWIDISKPHYGIHGTPRPETIGRAESHGCVRLTNWDAARLAQMISGKTTLLFEA